MSCRFGAGRYVIRFSTFHTPCENRGPAVCEVRMRKENCHIEHAIAIRMSEISDDCNENADQRIVADR